MKSKKKMNMKSGSKNQNRGIEEGKKCVIDSIKLNAISENIEFFLILVERSREKKAITDSSISLRMVYTVDTDDFEIFLDQVGGRIGSFTKIKNSESGASSLSKANLNEMQIKRISGALEVFMESIHEAHKNGAIIENILLKHNYTNGKTMLYYS